MVLVGLALLLSELVHSIIPHSVDYLFLAAIVASGWLGGRGPGLLAAGVAPLVLDYFFLPPLYTLWDQSGGQTVCAAVPAERPGRRLGELCVEHRQGNQSPAGAERRKISPHPHQSARCRVDRDENGRIVYISPKVADWTGYTAQEIYAGGSPFLLSRVHPDDLPRVLEATQALFSQGASLDEEFRFQRKDDAWIWFHNRAMGAWQENGVTFVDGVICDVSRRKWSELELQAKTAFLEAQANSTIDGILVVDAAGHRILQNRRFIEIFAIPSELLANPDDASGSRARDPEPLRIF